MQIINKVGEFFTNLFSKIFKGATECCGVKSLNNGLVTYLINDPNYPNLLVQVENPKTDGLNINVKFYIGSTPEGFDSVQGKAANVYGLLCHGINIFNKKLKLKKWFATPVLQVDPMAGQQANAFYDRQNLKFFFFNRNNDTVYTCLSSDIVSHELGHGILDAFRPDFFNMASMEVAAFHEAFGDITAMICTLHHPAVVDFMMQETGGNLRQHNIVTKLAEQFGKNLGCAYALRNAYNTFKYVKPSTLPMQGVGDGLANEPHSFSRIMSGIFYEVLCEIYEVKGRNRDALIFARDYLFDSFLDAVAVAPNSANFFETFCQSWLTIVSQKPESFKDIFNKVFANRAVFQARAMSSDEANTKFAKNHELTIKVGDIEVNKCNLSLSVSEIMPDMVMAQSDDLFGKLKVQIPVDGLVMQSLDGNTFNMAASVNEAVECAKDFVSYIVSNELYGDDENQTWTKDADDNLIRKYISCDCFMPNSTNPQAPEYQKGYKQLNNSGCCAYGSCANTQEQPGKKIEKSCNVRYHSSCGSVTYKGKC